MHRTVIIQLLVWSAVKGEMLISGNSMGIEEVSSRHEKQLCWCVSREARGQIEENVTSSDKFRGGEKTQGQQGDEWSKEGVESRERSEGAKLVSGAQSRQGRSGKREVTRR